MKKDIANRDDIILLVNSFYEKVKKDQVIGYIFNDVAKVNWEKHLPVMYDFWENVIFFTGAYTGNPMTAHKQLHQKTPLNAEHFQEWIKLFTQTVDELFEGDKAELTKQRAISIATVMQIKIVHGHESLLGS
ncbi:MAG TPA: group III truncated hemoglobin [Panacibacter sp.]|nr:group III truncated hemoglobin [Panacibacter sp.]